MILLIDNYDSFSYNLYQMIGAVNSNIKVIRNDEMTIAQIEELSPDRIIISPGPGRPENAGIIVEAARTVCKKIPTLGVCLGHQAICSAYGAEVIYAKKLMHGKQSPIILTAESVLFKGINGNPLVARYHSLAVNEKTLPSFLEVTAKADDGEIMAVQHKEYPIYGVQFHPESIMTPDGMRMLRNFLEV